MMTKAAWFANSKQLDAYAYSLVLTFSEYYNGLSI